MKDLKFKDFLDKNGNAHIDAPLWFKKRVDIRKAFPKEYF